MHHKARTDAKNLLFYDVLGHDGLPLGDTFSSLRVRDVGVQCESEDAEYESGQVEFQNHLYFICLKYTNPKKARG